MTEKQTAALYKRIETAINALLEKDPEGEYGYALVIMGVGENRGLGLLSNLKLGTAMTFLQLGIDMLESDGIVPSTPGNVRDH